MKLQKYISIIGLGLLLASCSKEPIMGGNESLPEGAVAISIELPEVTTARGEEIQGSYFENNLDDLKIFIFDATTKKFEKRFDIDPSYGIEGIKGNDSWDRLSRTLIISDLPNLTNKRIIYVIANWKISTADLSKITDIDKLEASFTEISGKISSYGDPLLMSCKAEHSFSSSKILMVKVKRQVAKIELTVNLNDLFIRYFPDLIFSESDTAKVELRNAPNRSYVCEQATPAIPTGNKMFSYKPDVIFASGTTLANTVWKATFYVYENPAKHYKDPNATYIIMKIPYKDGKKPMVTENYYKFKICIPNVQATQPTFRNKLYRVKATVTGFGTPEPSSDNVEVTTEMLEWNGVPVDAGTMGDIFVVGTPKINVTHDYITTVDLKATDPSKLAISTRDGKVSCTISPEGTSLLIKSKEQTSTKPIDDFDVITLTMGSLSETISVHYQPHIVYRFAAGNLVNETKFSDIKNQYTAKIGSPLDKGLHFRYGSTLGYLFRGHDPANEAMRNYYTASEFDKVMLKDATVYSNVPTEKQGWNKYALLTDEESHHTVGLSDICAYSIAGYRTPTAAEFVELLYGPTGTTDSKDDISNNFKTIYDEWGLVLGWAVGPNSNNVRYEGGNIIGATNPAVDGAMFLPITGRISTTAGEWENQGGFYMSASTGTSPYNLVIYAEIGYKRIEMQPDTYLGVLRCIRTHF
ncbi:MAG: hypothetical protein RR513_03795 [Muribaculaceae bacterium]